MTYQKLTVGPQSTNTYIVYDAKRHDALVIDPGAEPDNIREMLDGRTLSGIVLTHGHGDHIGAVRALRGPETPVYIHSLDSAYLTDTKLSLAVMIGAEAYQGAPDVLLEAGVIEIAGLAMEILHTPGHTPGSICLRCGNDLFSGDTLFCQGYGRVDFPGGSAEAMALSLRALLSLEGDIRVHPGHGPSTTTDAERRTLP